jgi:hypothetical protein
MVSRCEATKMAWLTNAVLCPLNCSHAWVRGSRFSEQSLFCSPQPWKACIEDGDAFSRGCRECLLWRDDFA